MKSRVVKGLCSVIAAASLLSGMPAMAAELPDLVQEDVRGTGDEENDDDVVSIKITDITAEMASNYAVNRAFTMGHDVEAGSAVKYFDQSGHMLGWMVPYVMDGQSCGYMLLDFTQEDFVSEFSFDDMSLVEDNGVMALSAGDEAVIVENGLWNYELVLRAGLPSILAEDPGLTDGYIVYATRAEFDENFYKLSPPDNEVLSQERWLDKFDPSDAITTDYVLKNWHRYSCACVVALEIVRQEGLDDDKSDEEIYKWFWKEMDCCPYDLWSDDFGFDWTIVANQEDDDSHTYAIENYLIYGNIIYGTANVNKLNFAIQKWYKVFHDNSKVNFLAQRISSQFYDNPVAEAISRNLSIYMGFGLSFTEESGSVGHAVNIVGWSKYLNDKYTRPGVIYFMIYDGHERGVKYINFSHTKWDYGPNSCYYFRNITNS